MKQYYADFHCHSDCSPDSNEPLQHHIHQAEKEGFSALCITDHWDLVEEVEGCFPTMDPTIDLWYQRYKEQVALAQSTAVDVYFGVEVGDGYAHPAQVNHIIQQYPFDFVIGSVHTLYNGSSEGIYGDIKKCTSEEEVEQFFQDYLKTLLSLAKEDFFDTLAHINYPFRYLPESFQRSLLDYLDQLDPIFLALIEGDRCLELNSCRGTTVDIWKPVLQRYQALGGYKVTLGSDAHIHEHLTLGIAPLITMLKELGFSAYYIYEKRVPKAIPLV